MVSPPPIYCNFGENDYKPLDLSDLSVINCPVSTQSTQLETRPTLALENCGHAQCQCQRMSGQETYWDQRERWPNPHALQTSPWRLQRWDVPWNVSTLLHQRSELVCYVRHQGTYWTNIIKGPVLWHESNPTMGPASSVNLYKSAVRYVNDNPRPSKALGLLDLGL